MVPEGIYPSAQILTRRGSLVRVRLPSGFSLDCEKGNDCTQNTCTVFVTKEGRGVAFGSTETRRTTQRTTEYVRSGRRAPEVPDERVKVLFTDPATPGSYWVGGDRADPTLIASGLFPEFLVQNWRWRTVTFYSIYGYIWGNLNSTGRGRAKWVFGASASSDFSRLEIRTGQGLSLSRLWERSVLGEYHHPLYHNNLWWQDLTSDALLPDWEPGDPGSSF